MFDVSLADLDATVQQLRDAAAKAMSDIDEDANRRKKEVMDQYGKDYTAALETRYGPIGASDA